MSKQSRLGDKRADIADALDRRRKMVDPAGRAAAADSRVEAGFNAAMAFDPSSLPVRVSLRLDLPSGGRIGPGEIALLEAIGEAGSISGAARLLGMSYPRAWNLVEALDAAIGVPVVTRAPGGAGGGGAELTAAGTAVIARYRALEAAAQQLAGPVPARRQASRRTSA